MAAYYNEIDPYAAQWLRNLISAGLIPAGVVDERDIREVGADQLRGYVQCHFFAGLGGWSRALRLAGWKQERGVWTGSCPCQPFSEAGKHKGFDDERHLWPAWRELIRQCRPSEILGEQVAAATQWLTGVRSDLEEMGYAVGAVPIEAACAGAPQLRDRYWFAARSISGTVSRVGSGRAEEPEREAQGRAVAGRAASRHGSNHQWQWIDCSDGRRRRIEPGIHLLADDVPCRVDKLRALGNAIVPEVAAEFIMAYTETF